MEPSNSTLERATAGELDAKAAVCAYAWRWVDAKFARRVPASLRALYGSEDLAGDVVVTCWSKLECLRLSQARDLRAWLAVVAAQRLVDVVRRENNLRQGRSRTTALGGDVAARYASPPERVEAEEIRARLTAGLTGVELRILAGKLAGFTTDELSSRTGWHRRRIQRLIRRRLNLAWEGAEIDV